VETQFLLAAAQLHPLFFALLVTAMSCLVVLGHEVAATGVFEELDLFELMGCLQVLRK
jgi:hypothetical protein